MVVHVRQRLPIVQGLGNAFFFVMLLHQFDDPLEAAGMRFSGIAAHDHDDIGVLDVDPVIGHRATTECGGQTGPRWAVSNSGLIIETCASESPEDLVSADGASQGMIQRRRSVCRKLNCVR